MTSSFQLMCDAVIADLTATVDGLSSDSLVTHTLWPADPEKFHATVGERHLAVWPSSQAQTANGQGITWDELATDYQVLVWEGVDTDSSRLMQDQDAIESFLECHDDMLARFYVVSNVTGLGNARLVRYKGSRFPDRPGPVRWFLMTLQSLAPMQYTPHSP